ncbi:MAG: nucleoside permease [Planctomycetes bacterium]|nr:nucleoside permease [Planctomycetota bacterium]
MQGYVGTRLSIMMFLQFFVWGAWYVTVGNYMTKIGIADSIGWVYTVGPIAAIISPFFLGMIADRFFATERVLGVMHILGGIALVLSPQLAELSVEQWAEVSRGLIAQGIDPAEQAKQYFINPAHYPFIGILLLHMLCFMPTLGLTNTLAFHNIKDQEKQFPIIRVFGTIGWIVANIVVSKVFASDETALPLQIGGGAAILLGVYCFSLPHTPPPSAGQKASFRNILGVDSFALLKDRSFSIFMVSSLLICIPLAAYYAFAQVFVNQAGFHNPAYSMSFGQMSEIFFMLIMPFFFRRLGVKWMLFIGMLAWVVRYGLFALGASDGVMWMILTGIVLHGICYDFFFVTGQIYVDKKAPIAIRGQAQGLLVLVTQGIGLGLGAQIVQRIINNYKVSNLDDLSTQAGLLRDQYDGLMKQAEESPGQADTLIAQANDVWGQASSLLLQTHDWQSIWMICAIAAGAVMILFALLYKDDPKTAEAVTEEDVAKAAAIEEGP